MTGRKESESEKLLRDELERREIRLPGGRKVRVIEKRPDGTYGVNPEADPWLLEVLARGPEQTGGEGFQVGHHPLLRFISAPSQIHDRRGGWHKRCTPECYRGGSRPTACAAPRSPRLPSTPMV